jgi:hypothetical protein
MEKENLKLTNTISSLITDDLKKNTKHESPVTLCFSINNYLLKQSCKYEEV